MFSGRGSDNTCRLDSAHRPVTGYDLVNRLTINFKRFSPHRNKRFNENFIVSFIVVGVQSNVSLKLSLQRLYVTNFSHHFDHVSVFLDCSRLYHSAPQIKITMSSPHHRHGQQTRLSCLVGGVNRTGDKSRLFSVILNILETEQFCPALSAM